jgi:hypothetical protein
MGKDDRDLLEVLKFELLFLRKRWLWPLAVAASFLAGADYFRRLTHLHELRRA